MIAASLLGGWSAVIKYEVNHVSTIHQLCKCFFFLLVCEARLWERQFSAACQRETAAPAGRRCRRGETAAPGSRADGFWEAGAAQTAGSAAAGWKPAASRCCCRPEPRPLEDLKWFRSKKSVENTRKTQPDKQRILIGRKQIHVRYQHLSKKIQLEKLASLWC